MDYNFTELINSEKVQALLHTFQQLTGLQSSITDVHGNVLYTNDGHILGGKWQRICIEFHRVHPETLSRCIDSDTRLSRRMSRGKGYASYKCLNGLHEVAIPIVIDGAHIVNLFMGQFFKHPPDMDFFRKQAAEFGFDEADYLSAVKEVRVVPEKDVRQGIKFLKNLGELITEMGLAKKQLLNSAENLEKKVQERTRDLTHALEEIKTLKGILPFCSFCKKIRDDKGYWEQVDVYISRHTKADISHSVCPACMKKHYPEIFEEMLEGAVV